MRESVPPVPDMTLVLVFAIVCKQADRTISEDDGINVSQLDDALVRVLQGDNTRLRECVDWHLLNHYITAISINSHDHLLS